MILYKSTLNNQMLYIPYVLWIGFALQLNYLSIDKIQYCIET